MKHQSWLFVLFCLVLTLISVFPKLDLAAPHRERMLDITSRDYIISDSEYGQILDRLQREANDSIVSDRRNFVSDETDIAEIVRMIESNSTTTENQNSIIDATTESSNLRLVTTASEIPDLTAKKETDEVNSISPLRIHEQVRATSIIAPIDIDTTTINPECPICLEPFNGGPFELTPCAHKFHPGCLESWKIIQLQGNQVNRCPLCRNQISYPNYIHGRVYTTRQNI